MEGVLVVRGHAAQTDLVVLLDKLAAVTSAVLLPTLSAVVMSMCPGVARALIRCVVTMESAVPLGLVAAVQTSAVSLTYLMTSSCLNGPTRL